MDFLTSENVAAAAERLDGDALAEWLVASIKEAVDPLMDMTDAELARIAHGGKPPPMRRAWLTPPMAKLQLRLRAILADQELAP